MRQVRELTTQELEDSITLSANAYPGLELSNRANRIRYRERVALLDRDPDTRFYGLFEDEQLRGIMRWHDFTMNLFGTKTVVGGLGAVAVDLLHKKEKIAADMVRAFLDHYKASGAAMAALYPFRPDFYRRMGFGYGAPMHHYRFAPGSLPTGSTKSGLVFLNASDRHRLHDCYMRDFGRTHGMIARRPQFWDLVLNEPTIRLVGIEKKGRLAAYIWFGFEDGRHDNFLSNTIHVREMIYETAADLNQLLSFLHTQADQIETISYNTQQNSFYYLLGDPRMDAGALLPHTIAHENSRSGLSIMYRVLDIPRLFEVLEDHNFNEVTCRLQLNLSDSFFSENEGRYVVDFVDGTGRLAPAVTPEVTLSMDVAEFSSLVIGAVHLRNLVQFGLATLSDAAYLGRLDRLFSGPTPICLTSF